MVTPCKDTADKSARNKASKYLFMTLLYQRLQAWTIGCRLLIHPLVGEGAALFWTNRINTAAVLRIEHRTGSIGTVLQDQPLSVGRNIRLIGDEVRLAHSQIRGNPRRVTVLQANYALNTATSSALMTDKSGMVETEGLEPPTLTV